MFGNQPKPSPRQAGDGPPSRASRTRSYQYGHLRTTRQGNGDGRSERRRQIKLRGDLTDVDAGTHERGLVNNNMADAHSPPGVVPVQDDARLLFVFFFLVRAEQPQSALDVRAAPALPAELRFTVQRRADAGAARRAAQVVPRHEKRC
jgi:hypothetical protein